MKSDGKASVRHFAVSQQYTLHCVEVVGTRHVGKHREVGRRNQFDAELVDASEQFMGHLKGVSDPEAKRKIIGKLFVDVFHRSAHAAGYDGPVFWRGRARLASPGVSDEADAPGARHLPSSPCTRAASRPSASMAAAA